METDKEMSNEPSEVKTREEALALIRDNMEQIRQQALIEAQRYEAKQTVKPSPNKRSS